MVILSKFKVKKEVKNYLKFFNFSRRWRKMHVYGVNNTKIRICYIFLLEILQNVTKIKFFVT